MRMTAAFGGRRSRNGMTPGIAAWLVATAHASACGPAPAPVTPSAETPDVAAAPGADAGEAARTVDEDGAGAVETPPAEMPTVALGPVPDGFETAPVPEGASVGRILWRVEGPLAADAVRGPLEGVLPEVVACLAAGVPGERLPLHFIVGASGRVEEIGGPLVETGRATDVTCAQTSLRSMRFPESDADTIVRLVFEWGAP